MASKVRVSVCLNIGQKKGCPGDARCGGTSAPIVVPLETEAILAAAANKLKLKKKQVDVARLYVWGTGYELPRGATTFEDGRVSNGTLVAISLGEPTPGRQRRSRRPLGTRRRRRRQPPPSLRSRRRRLYASQTTPAASTLASRRCGRSRRRGARRTTKRTTRGGTRTAMAARPTSGR